MFIWLLASRYTRVSECVMCCLVLWGVAGAHQTATQATNGSNNRQSIELIVPHICKLRQRSWHCCGFQHCLYANIWRYINILFYIKLFNWRLISARERARACAHVFVRVTTFELFFAILCVWHLLRVNAIAYAQARAPLTNVCIEQSVIVNVLRQTARSFWVGQRRRRQRQRRQQIAQAHRVAFCGRSLAFSIDFQVVRCSVKRAANNKTQPHVLRTFTQEPLAKARLYTPAVCPK